MDFGVWAERFVNARYRCGGQDADGNVLGDGHVASYLVGVDVVSHLAGGEGVGGRRADAKPREI